MNNLVFRDLFYNKLCSSVLINNKIRRFLYSWGGVKLDKGVVISPRCFLGSNNLEIGENTFVN